MDKIKLKNSSPNLQTQIFEFEISNPLDKDLGMKICATLMKMKSMEFWKSNSKGIENQCFQILLRAIFGFELTMRRIKNSIFYLIRNFNEHTRVDTNGHTNEHLFLNFNRLSVKDLLKQSKLKLKKIYNIIFQKINFNALFHLNKFFPFKSTRIYIFSEIKLYQPFIRKKTPEEFLLSDPETITINLR